MTNNNEMIDHAIGLLMMQNEEDAAQTIDNLRKELERVKGIAFRRLDRIAQLQHNLAVVEDKLEDTRSELRDTRESAHIAIGERNARIADLELGREPRSHLENELADLRASSFRSADAMQYIVNYCRGER